MNMHCSETISLPLKIMHIKDLTRFRDGITGSGAFPRRGIGKSRSDLMERIGEYSQKNMSFEHDALNGFLGVLHAYEKLGVTAHHVTGISSIWVCDINEYTGIPFDSEIGEWSLAPGLAWVADQKTGGFLKRREGFPSWSWVGWYGSALQKCQYFCFEGTLNRNLDRVNKWWDWNLRQIDIRLEVESESGKLIPWTASTLLRIFPRRLHVCGWTTQLRIAESFPQDGAMEMAGSFGYPPWPINMTVDPNELSLTRKSFVDELWTGLVLCWGTSSSIKATILILKATREGTFERIGIGNARCSLSNGEILATETIIDGRKFVRQRLVLE